MTSFTQGQEQPDEGYSEDPLNPLPSSTLSLSSPRSPADVSAWAARNLPSLSLAAKKREVPVPALCFVS